MSVLNPLIITFLFVASVLFMPARDAHAVASTSDGGDLQHVLGTYASDLAKLTGDEQALALFTSSIGPALDLKDGIAVLAGKSQSSDRKDSRDKASADVERRAIELTRDLAAWHLALRLLSAAEAGPAAIDRFLRDSTSQYTWLAGKDGRTAMREAWKLATTLAAIPIPMEDELTMLDGYRDYSAAVDRTYPHFTGTDNAWLAIVEREGNQGVLSRLTEDAGLTSKSDRGPLATRYFHERLRPVLTAHLVARAIRAEAAADQQTRDELNQFRQLRDGLREQRALARLCGTWQWTIHNHQNHADHKMMMAFPPPDAPAGAGPKPAKTVVLGDTVYLRWEFDRGIIQEDSLLFSKEGLRLEGTFVNSGGAWGGISAKRTAGCGGTGGPAASMERGDPANSPAPGRPSRR